MKTIHSIVSRSNSDLFITTIDIRMQTIFESALRFEYTKEH